ncbi:MAG: ABC transporter permease, partial [Chloroflexi bacterium]|nr:ABC transporter permease [Chloroflexota bacterium]
MRDLSLKSVFNRILDVAPLPAALLAAFVVASILLVALNAAPGQAFASMLQGAFGTENATAETLVKAIPILFVAIGICVAFRGGVINIGGEGQMIAGALAGVTTALVLADAPGPVIIIVSLLAGFLAGALYGGLAGFLKAYFNVNEILSTIMLNQIAVQMMNYLLNGPLLDPTEAGLNHIPKTARIIRDAQLPNLSIVLPDGLAALVGLENVELFARTRLHFGLLIAVILAFVMYVLLWRTTIGYRIRAVGQNERASRYAGINVRRQTVLAMWEADTQLLVSQYESRANLAYYIPYWRMLNDSHCTTVINFVGSEIQAQGLDLGTWTADLLDDGRPLRSAIEAPVPGE